MGNYDERYFEGSEFFSLEKFVEADEKILWQGKPDRTAHILAQVFKMLPIAIIWLAFDSALIAIMAVGGVFGKMPVIALVFICLFFVFHLFPVWVWIWNIITAGRRQKNTEYVFTDKRIILKSGTVGITVNSVYYADISGVNLKIGLTDRVFKVGDIYISGGFSAQVLWDIKNPYEVCATLQKIVGEQKKDTYFPNALRP